MAPIIKPSLLALLIACAPGIPGVVHAQSGAPAAPAGLQALPASAPVISEIKYAFEGTRKIDESSAAAHVRLKVGDPYKQEASDSSIRALYSTGFYEFVSIDPERLPDNKVRVTILLVPRLRVKEILFEGNKEWDANSTFFSDLMSESALKEGDPLDEVLVKRTVEKIVKKYDKYYPFTEVIPKIDRDEVNGTATITFIIKEGLATKVDEIQFIGNEHIRELDLRNQIDTSTWAWTFDPADFPGWRFVKFSWLSGYGRFHKEEFRLDLSKLRDFYRNQGFLDVEVPDEAVEKTYVETSDTKGRMAIKIKLSEGRRYSVGEVKITGNKLGEQFARFKSESILTYLAQRRRDTSRPYPIGDRVLDMMFSGGVRALDTSEVRTNFDSLQAGDWYSPKAIDAALEKIRDYYGQVGYLECDVRVTRRPNLATGKIDLTFNIIEREKFYLGTLNIRGNTKTRSRVIVRELALAPGEVFDSVRMKTSEIRLRNTRYFEDVRLSPEKTNIPNRQNLRIELREGRTGSLSFGAGFSTVEQLVGFAEYSESNFDLFNYRNYFRGGGQKFRVRVSIGNVSSAIEQSFEEPWFFERELAVGYNAYMTTNSYASDDYEVRRTGVNFYLRRRLFELVQAQLGYTIEDTRLDNVVWNAPGFIRSEEGSKLISKVGLTLTRDTRNDVFFPTYGNRFSLSQYVAGGPFGGDVNYYQIEARGAQWIPIFDAGEQTLQLIGRVGAMVHYDNTSIPFYERFNLGGAYNMRGFKYNHVGPFEDGEPKGGNSYVYLSAEYTIKLIEQLRFAVFYDWGFVNSSGFDFRANQYNDDIGFGFRVLVMGAVMRIDVGVPLTTSKDNDDGVRFNFSFGTVF
ncbi:MAG: BamA/TamA family outer membrane protein [Puniceicoccales bacterium]|jgi:outer membrane protein insertion porin family|nr:BamA/TamA family outer membrane protein [Puniceicoccales bacterium]